MACDIDHTGLADAKTFSNLACVEINLLRNWFSVLSISLKERNKLKNMANFV